MDLNTRSVLSLFNDALLSEARIFFKDPERASAIYTRFIGLHGADPESYKALSLIYGVSRQSIRKYCNRFVLLVGTCFATSEKYHEMRLLVSQADNLLFNAGAGTLDAVRDKLLGQQLSQNIHVLIDGECPSALIRLTEILGLSSSVRLEKWRHIDVVVPNEHMNCFNPLYFHAKKVVTAAGAISALHLISSFSRLKGIGLSEMEADVMLRTFGEFLIDEDKGGEVTTWYVFKDLVDNKVKRIRKIIGSLGYCSMSQISARDFGNAPSNTKRAFSKSVYAINLPKIVLTALLKRNGFVIIGDRITLKKISTLDKLPQTQLKMVAIMRKMSVSGPVPTSDFIKECINAGINKNTAILYAYRRCVFVSKDGISKLA